MTWRSTTGDTELIISPSDAVTDFMIRGVTSLPAFAIVAIADVICNGVTPTSCPIGMRVMEILLHACGGRITPLISPGSSIPVRSPNPKRRMYS
jgi:hypothetical protein